MMDEKKRDKTSTTLEDIDESKEETRYVVVPIEMPKCDESEYRGNLLTNNQMSDMPDLELRDLIMKKKFGASPDM